jgi:L-ascorbate metabolism protein UlaG (beta-lactamase superfamily)
MSLTIKYYGHATLTINTDGVRIIVDPFLAPHNPLAPVGHTAIVTDFILQTHGHGDHIADTVAIAKRTGAQVICNFEISNWLQAQGVSNVHPMHIGGAHTFKFGRAKMTIAHHGSGLPDGSYGGNPAGFLINFNDGHDVYISGDTALTYDMKLIGEAGGVDLAILCIGDNFTMGPEDAVLAAQFIQTKHVIPVHYKTWPVIDVDPQAFARKLRRIAGIECSVLAPGEEITF